MVRVFCAFCVLYGRDNKCGFEQCNGKFKFGGTKGSYVYVFVVGRDTTAATTILGDFCSIRIQSFPCIILFLLTNFARMCSEISCVIVTIFYNDDRRGAPSQNLIVSLILPTQIFHFSCARDRQTNHPSSAKIDYACNCSNHPQVSGG